MAAGLAGAALPGPRAPAPVVTQQPTRQKRGPKARKTKRRKGPAPRRPRPTPGLYRLMIQREREIGVHPKYRHSQARHAPLAPSAAQWEAARDAFNRQHGISAP